eukprot:484646_1
MNDSENTWNCLRCTYLNNGGYNCVICGTKKEIENNNEWSCNICTFMNVSQSNLCQMCGQSRQNKSKWICLVCTFENVAEYDICEICGNHKEQKTPETSDDSFEPNLSKNNKCIDIKECNALKNLITALKGKQEFEALNYQSMRSRKQESFDDYCNKTYPNVLNEYIHFIEYHSHQIEEINKLISHSNLNSKPCNITECTAFDRHYRDNCERIPNKSNDEVFTFCGDLLDRFHYYIHHLFDIGMRIKTDEMKQIETKAPEETFFDYKFAQKQKIINDKRGKYKVNRFKNNNNK